MSSIVWTHELKQLVNRLPDNKRIFVGDGNKYSDRSAIEKVTQVNANGADDKEYDYILCVKEIGDGYLGGYGE